MRVRPMRWMNESRTEVTTVQMLTRPHTHTEHGVVCVDA